MGLKHILSLCLFLNIGLLIGQQFGPSLEDEFVEYPQIRDTALDSLRVWQEQVLLHTDKEILAPKDHLFFKAYMLTGPEQLRVSASNVLKMELLDTSGNLVESQYHQIVNGAAAGSFMVPKKIEAGKYYLRAYTRWMLNYGPENFATKEISILDKKRTPTAPNLNDRNIKVFPEGGNLVAGLENKIAVNLEGFDTAQIHVVDENGKKVTEVQNYGNGVGTFLLTPQPSKEYSLEVGEGKRYSLATISEVGYTMQVNTINEKKAVVKITPTEDLRKQDVYLRGRINGISYFESKVDFDKASSIEVDIPKANLPNGILQLQLEDEFDQVWAKRPLHIDNNELQFRVQKTSDAEGELIKIMVNDIQGEPVQTELSVVLGKDYSAVGNTINFENTRNQRYLNDLLVLVDQLPMEYALNNSAELPSEIRYNFQRGLEFYGRAYDLDAVPLPNTKIQIVISGEGEAQAYEVQTNDEGLFKLSDLQLQGEADMVFRRAAEDQRDKFVKVIPYQYETPPLTLKAGKTEGNDGLNSKQFIPKKQVAEFKQDENTERLITLEGVTLVGEKFKSKKRPSLYNMEPTHTVYQDPDRPKTLPQMFLGIPGVQVRNLGNVNPPPSLSLTRRGGLGGPLWVLDGVPLMQAPVDAREVSPLAEMMAVVPFGDIERVELILGSEAAMFGSRGGAGVILVYTRNGSDESFLDRKKAQLKFQGYSNSLSFEEHQEQMNDKRGNEEKRTLYWNPSLSTDENGEAIVRLPKLSGSERMRLEVKTITPDGKSGTIKTVL